VIVAGNARGAGIAPALTGFGADPAGSRDRQADLLEVTVSAGTIVLIVLILVIVAALAAVASIRMRRTAAERSLVGPEYDRLAGEVGPRKAKAEFEKRRQRVDGLGIRSLSAERRTAYTGQWDAVQEQFVDSPARAVSAAGELVTAVAADRGYEVTDNDQLMTDLSVNHGRNLDGYRSARQTTGRAGEATTEALRRALLDYRRLFYDLLESPDAAGLAADREPGMAPAAQVPAQRPWKQVTQGRHWKTRQQESSDVAAARR
jgi:hypothetical protein